MMKLQIEHEDSQGNTRVFTAQMAAWVQANACWDGGSAETNTRRPVFAVLIASTGEAGPVRANLSRGGKALVYERGYGHRGDVKERFEFLRSAGYRWLTQPTPGGAVLLTAWLPELFLRDPGLVDPDHVKFVSLPRLAWVQRQRWDEVGLVNHLVRVGCTEHQAQRWAGLAPQARLLGEALDRRTRAPFPATTEFLAQLCAALEREHMLQSADSVRYPGEFVESGLDPLGYAPAFAVAATQHHFEDVLTTELRRYFEQGGEVLHGAA